MGLDIHKIETSLCQSMCAEVRLHPRPGEDRIMVETPFTFEDGDAYSLFMEPLPSGGVKLTDCGHTLMHLSYSMDVDALREGTRAKLFDRVVTDGGLEDKDGELVLESSMEQLGQNVFRFGQALTRIHDLTFLSRLRTESTFFEDLAAEIKRIVPDEKVHKDYILPGRDQAAAYTIDYYIDASAAPVFLFAVNNTHKARLTTVVIEHWLREKVDFESLIVFEDQTVISKPDFSRLMNVGGDMISSLDARDAFARKLLKRIAVTEPSPRH